MSRKSGSFGAFMHGVKGTAKKAVGVQKKKRVFGRKKVFKPLFSKRKIASLNRKALKYADKNPEVQRWLNAKPFSRR